MKPDDYEDEFYDDEEDFDAFNDCGRWVNGQLGSLCSLAGTEFCDWECPYSH